MLYQSRSFQDFYKSLTILCVEDDPAILQLYRSIFSSMFDRVYTAADGNEGLEIFRKASIDIRV